RFDPDHAPRLIGGGDEQDPGAGPHGAHVLLCRDRLEVGAARDQLVAVPALHAEEPVLGHELGAAPGGLDALVLGAVDDRDLGAGLLDAVIVRPGGWVAHDRRAIPSGEGAEALAVEHGEVGVADPVVAGAVHHGHHRDTRLGGESGSEATITCVTDYQVRFAGEGPGAGLTRGDRFDRYAVDQPTAGSCAVLGENRHLVPGGEVA